MNKAARNSAVSVVENLPLGACVEATNSRVAMLNRRKHAPFGESTRSAINVTRGSAGSLR